MIINVLLRGLAQFTEDSTSPVIDNKVSVLGAKLNLARNMKKFRKSIKIEIKLKLLGT